MCKVLYNRSLAVVKVINKILYRTAISAPCAVKLCVHKLQVHTFQGIRQNCNVDRGTMGVKMTVRDQ